MPKRVDMIRSPDLSGFGVLVVHFKLYHLLNIMNNKRKIASFESLACEHQKKDADVKEIRDFIADSISDLLERGVIPPPEIRDLTCGLWDRLTLEQLADLNESYTKKNTWADMASRLSELPILIRNPGKAFGTKALYDMVGLVSHIEDWDLFMVQLSYEVPCALEWSINNRKYSIDTKQLEVSFLNYLRSGDFVELSKSRATTAVKSLKIILTTYLAELSDKVKYSLEELNERLSFIYFLGLGEKFLKFHSSAFFALCWKQDLPKTPLEFESTECPGMFLSGAGYSLLQYIKRTVFREKNWHFTSLSVSILMWKFGCAYPSPEFLDSGLRDHVKGVCRLVIDQSSWDDFFRSLPYWKEMSKSISVRPDDPVEKQDRDNVKERLNDDLWFKQLPLYSQEALGFNQDSRLEDCLHNPLNDGKGLDEIFIQSERIRTRKVRRFRPIDKVGFVSPSTSSHLGEQYVACDPFDHPPLDVKFKVQEKDFDEETHHRWVTRNGGSFFEVMTFYKLIWESWRKDIYDPKEECICYTALCHRKDFLSPCWDSISDFAEHGLVPLDVEPVALPEELKVRVITLGMNRAYHQMMNIQRSVHSFLRDKGAFRLIGEPISSDLILQEIPVLPRGAFFVSADYKAATDNLHPVLSLEAARVIADRWGFDEVEKRRFLFGLCGHRINYPGRSFTSQDPRNNDIKGKSYLQTHGQLMGSPVSFPVLCLVNDACLRQAAVEYLQLVEQFSINGVDNLDLSDGEDFVDYVRGILQGRGYLINGDDALFCAVPRFYDIWKRIVTNCGLVLSVGKNYTSRDFCIINSNMFLVEQNDLCQGGRYELNHVGWLNLGLLDLGIRDRPVALSFVKDKATKSIAGNFRDFLRGVPTYCSVYSKFHSLFFNNWLPYLKEVVPQGVPYWVSEVNGGLGFPINPSISRETISIQQMKYCEYFSHNVIQEYSKINGLGRISDASVLPWIKSPEILDVGVMDNLPYDGGFCDDLRMGYEELMRDLEGNNGSIDLRSFRSSFKSRFVETFKRVTGLKDLSVLRKNRQWCNWLDDMEMVPKVLPPSLGVAADVVKLLQERNFVYQFQRFWRTAQQHSSYPGNRKIIPLDGRVCKVLWRMTLRKE